MTKIIKTLLEMPDSADFREPVDWRGLGLDDYPQSHREAHGFGGPSNRISSASSYHSSTMCVADIRLIWSNCKKYNGEGSDFYDLADRLSKRFEELFAKAKSDASSGPRGRRRRPRRRSGEKMRQSINDVAADLVCPITQNCRSTLLWLKMGRSTNEMPSLSG